MIQLFNISVFPEKYNLSELTYDPKILENWLIIMGFVFAGAIITFICLNMMVTSIKTPINNTAFYWLEKIEKKPRKNNKLKILIFLEWLVCAMLAFGGFALVGFASSSYSQLIVFFIIPTYGILFGKFIRFDSAKSNKYKIIKKEN
ncbi:hypothetical protein [Amphibacillus jilinensis]|uniref:hypothetical protein n=1 Tax=Amphibacillus jilinensis TaxID=1216008 RepID=UPI00118185E1|nr:hypothetical protein [Amphibacillus jilinensis]